MEEVERTEPEAAGIMNDARRGPSRFRLPRPPVSGKRTRAVGLKSNAGCTGSAC